VIPALFLKNPKRNGVREPMKKVILKIAAVAVLAATTVLFGQIFAPSIGRTNNSAVHQPTIIDLGQAPAKSSADFANYARKLFEQAKAKPRVVEAWSLIAGEGASTPGMSGSTGFSVEPELLPGTTGSGLPLAEEGLAWPTATFPAAAYAVLWLAIGAGLTLWVIHVVNSHQRRHGHAI
jgi:hypothetical protein